MAIQKSIRGVTLFIIILVIFSLQIPGTIESSAYDPPQDKYHAVDKYKNTSNGADLIFHNAIIHTMDDLLPGAQAVAIQGNRILAVGSDVDMLALQGQNTQIYDLEQRTMFPGLIDNHSHRLQGALWDKGPDGLAQATRDMAADGYTTVHELYGDAGTIECAQSLAGNNELAVRINCYIPYNTNGGEMVDDWQTYPYTVETDTTVRVVGAKIFADGGSVGAAALTTLYQSGSAEGTYGDIFMTQEQMNTAVFEVLSAGYPVAMHVLGDSGVVVGLDAFEHAFGGGGNVLRSRMEHLRVMQEGLVDQMADLGIVASIQYTWANATSAPTFENMFLPEVLGWVYPWQRMADQGITIAGGNDYPYCSRSQAMQTISMLATRKTYESDVVPDWMQGDALTVAEGIRAMTVTNAWLVFEENDKGTITPGKLADLTILSDDPLSMDPFNVRDITIEMTVMDGEIRHNQIGISHTAVHDAGTFDMGIDDRGLWGQTRAPTGLTYNGFDHLYHGTALISYDENTIATAISQSDYITSTEGWVNFNEPGDIATEEATVIYEDGNSNHPGKIQINQKTYMWENEPFLLVEYMFTNIGDNDLSDLYLGQFVDLDVVNYGSNMGGWDTVEGAGFSYMYDTIDPNTPYIGMAMFDSLGNTANSALTFVRGFIPNNNNETNISNLMRNHTIESNTTEPADYALLMSGGPYDIQADSSIAPFYLAFAVGDSYQELKDAITLAVHGVEILTHVDTPEDRSPESLILQQNYPNPFNASTTISYALPRDAFIDLSIYDTNGHHVQTLESGIKKAGPHRVIWSPGESSSGVYIIRIHSKEFQFVRKAMYMK
jgi:predicted amidohydrolase YtcJ